MHRALDEVIYVVTEDHAKEVKIRDERRRGELRRRTGPAAPSRVIEAVKIVPKPYQPSTPASQPECATAYSSSTA